MDALRARYPGVSKTEPVERAVRSRLWDDAASRTDWHPRACGCLGRPSRRRPAPVIVLPDTSVWVSFLREGAHGRAAALDGLLAGQQVVACRPVVTEILAGARDVQRSELRTLWSCLPRADLGRRQWQHVGGLAARLRPGHIGTTGVAALRPRLTPPSDTSLVQYRWDGTGGQRLAAQKISSSGYGGSGATAPYATLKLLPP